MSRRYHEDITLGGRLSVRYQENGKPQSMQAKFSWAQSKDTVRITLFSPLGQTMAQIAIQPGLVTLQRAGEPLRQAADVAELTTRMLGWPLPVAGLQDWLQGFMRDERGMRRMAESETEASFRSDGWQVRYVSWQAGVASAAYPKRIDLDRLTQQAGELGLRIVIDNWQPQ
jgi:outer membrane lipoprotein LolB